MSDGRGLQKREDSEIVSTQGQRIWLPGYELASGSPPKSTIPHLWDYIWTVWHRRWLVVLTVLLCVSVAALTVLRATPLFEATAKLRIEQDSPRILSFEEGTIASTGDWRTDFIDTQVQIIRNRTLAGQVVEQLGLFLPDEDEKQKSAAPKSAIAEFLSYLKSLGGNGPEPAPRDPQALAEAEIRSRVDAFLASLSVDQVRDSQIVEVRYLADDPTVAAETANALCEAFIRWNYESQLNVRKYAREWLEQKLDTLKAKLEESEEALYKFAGGKDMLPLADSTGELSKQLAETARKLAEAERELFEKQYRLRMQESTTGSVTALPPNSRTEKLAADLASVEVKLGEARVRYGPDLPEVKALETSKERIEAMLNEERRQALETLRMECEQARGNRDFLERSHEQMRERIVQLQQRLVQYNILQREIDVNKELYNSLLQRSREVTVASGLKAGNVSIVETAEAPNAPKFPRKARSLMLAVFLGLFLGVGMAFFVEYMDTTVKSAEDVQRLAQLPLLGVLPHHGNGRRGAQATAPVELVTDEKPQSAVAEQVRSLRTAVMYSQADHAPKMILVTSLLPAEGKTTVSINLAVAFAQAGRKVLLVDADLKRPGLHRFFGIDHGHGLTELLTGEVDTAAVSDTRVHNLHVLPSGPKTPNPAELLDSDSMRDFLTSARDEFDEVIIDSAPLSGITDTEVLMPHVDGVILVVQPGKTPRAALGGLKERMLAVRGRILGTVLNNPKSGRIPWYGYGDGYGYWYGQGTPHAYGEEGGNGNGGRKSGRGGNGKRLDTVLPPPRS